MIVTQRAFAGLRFAHRNARLRGELSERLVRLAVEHAAAGNDQRLLARANPFDGAAKHRSLGRRPRNLPDAILEQLDRVIEGFGLHILRQRERDGARLGRRGEHAHDFGQERS